MTTYTRPGYGAIALGSLCSLGTAAVLLEDVRHTGTFNIDHGLSIIVLIVTIGAGVMASAAVRGIRWIEGAALAALAVLGTWYCLTATAGRTAETRETASLTATRANGTRERAQAAYETALADLEAAKQKLQAERDAKRCSICKREKLAVEDAQKAVDAADDKLQDAPAAVPVNAKVANIAALIALAPIVTADRAQVEEVYKLIDPNLAAFILEFGSILLWHIGLARRQPIAVAAPAAQPAIEHEALPPPPADREPLQELEEPAEGYNSPGIRERRQQVASFVVAYRARHGRDPSTAEVTRATGLPKTTAWRLIKKVA